MKIVYSLVYWYERQGVIQLNRVLENMFIYFPESYSTAGNVRSNAETITGSSIMEIKWLWMKKWWLPLFEIANPFGRKISRDNNTQCELRDLLTLNIVYVVLGGLVVIVLATGPNVLGFEPGREW
jgi:hypothetical protein